tara:strand:- start:254 stop:427 length:174 start_codon:yes stop_codon:yes gene_type:complete
MTTQDTSTYKGKTIIVDHNDGTVWVDLSYNEDLEQVSSIDEAQELITLDTTTSEVSF